MNRALGFFVPIFIISLYIFCFLGAYYSIFHIKYKHKVLHVMVFSSLSLSLAHSLCACVYDDELLGMEKSKELRVQNGIH